MPRDELALGYAASLIFGVSLGYAEKLFLRVRLGYAAELFFRVVLRRCGGITLSTDTSNSWGVLRLARCGDHTLSTHSLTLSAFPLAWYPTFRR